MKRITFSICLLTLVACKPRGQTINSSNVLADGSGEEPTPEQFNESASIFSDKIHELHIHMRGATFKKVVTHKNEGGDACKANARYGHVEKFVFRNSASGETVEIRDVGIKVKGNTSCSNFQKQYKIKFNADADFIENKNEEVVHRVSQVFQNDGDDVVYSPSDSKRIEKQSFYGLKTIALRLSQNDPTLLREKISGEVFAYGDHLKRKNGLPGAPTVGGGVYRTGFVRVYMHKGQEAEDFGVFDLVELVDRTMFKSRYGDAIDHAYQLNYTEHAKGDFKSPDLSDRDLFEAYEPDFFNGKGVASADEIKILATLKEQGKIEPEILEKAEKRRSKAGQTIRQFIKDVRDANTPEKLAAQIDVENFLNYMVAVNLTGHWDSALGNANNDYIVFNKDIGRWQMAVWDLDNSFGSLATGTSAFNTVWNAGPREFKRGSTDLLTDNERPLFGKVMKFFGDRYQKRYAEFLDGIYEFNRINGRIVELRNVFTGGDNNDDRWQTLFKFKNHRHAHGVCGIRFGKRGTVDVNGWPIYANLQRGEPKCQ